MFIYVSMMIWNAFCGLLSKDAESICIIEGRIEKRSNLFFSLITMAYIAFFIGQVDSLFDLVTYQEDYASIPSEPSQIGEYMKNVEKYPGFFGLQVLFKSFISTDFFHFNLTLVIFDCIAILYLYRKYSCSFAFSIFLFLASEKHIWMINGIKQFLAVCIIFCFSKYLMENKFWKFAIGVLVASLFHTSALVVIPVYFFVHGKPWNKKMILILIGSILAITFVAEFTDIIDILLSDSIYDASVLTNNSGGSNWLRIPIAAAPAIIALITRKKIEITAPKYINICINMSLVSACIYLVATFTSGIHMGRLPIYFELYGYISLPWLLNNAFDEETCKTAKITCVVCYLIMYYLISWETPYFSKVLDIYMMPYNIFILPN